MKLIYIFLYLKANIKAMNTTTLSGKIICVGTGKKTSINDLVEFLNKKYNPKKTKKIVP